MRRHRRRERGSALVIVLVTVVGILGLLGILFPLSQSNMQAQRQTRQQFDINLLIRAAVADAFEEIRLNADQGTDGRGAVGLDYAYTEASGDGFNLPDALETQLGLTDPSNAGPASDDLSLLGKPLQVGIDLNNDGDEIDPGEAVRTVGRYMVAITRDGSDRSMLVVVAIPNFLQPDQIAGAEVRFSVPSGGARHALSFVGSLNNPNSLEITHWGFGSDSDTEIEDPTLVVPAINIDDLTTAADSKMTDFIADAEKIRGLSVNGGVPVPNERADTVENSGVTPFSIDAGKLGGAVDDIIAWINDLKANAMNAPANRGIEVNENNEDMSDNEDGGKDGSGVHTYNSIGTGNYDPTDASACDLFILGEGESDEELDMGDNPGGWDGIDFRGSGVLLIENGNGVQLRKSSNFEWTGDVIWHVHGVSPAKSEIKIEAAKMTINGNLFIVVDPSASNKEAKLKLDPKPGTRSELVVTGSLVMLAPGDNKVKLELKKPGGFEWAPRLTVDGLLVMIGENAEFKIEGAAFNHSELTVNGGFVFGQVLGSATDLKRFEIKDMTKVRIIYDEAKYTAAFDNVFQRVPSLLGWENHGYLERPGAEVLRDVLNLLLEHQSARSNYSNE